MTSPIAGAVLPIKRAEELILSLPGVVSAKILAGDNGTIEQIHVLTTQEFTAKQVVRNIESALVAHLSMRIDHRKISVAVTSEPVKSGRGTARERVAAVAVLDQGMG